MTIRPSNRSPVALDLSVLHNGSGWLEAEIEATHSPGTRALILYEAGLLHEQLGNATDAARLHLQAVNSDPQLAEPAERLLALFEQRHSLKNLGRVVERLGELATTVEARERAYLERAAFALIEQRDANTARQVLLDAVEAVPSSTIAWNLLNLVAEQTRDLELLQRTLKSRANLSDNAAWSGLLLLELAEVQDDLGQFEAALASLDRVIEGSGPITFLALDRLESLAFSHHQYEVLSRALVSQASMLERTTHDASIGDSLGVPRWRRSDLHVADTFLRAALARHTAGSSGEAATLLERALSLVPNDPILQHSALLCAEERHDIDLSVSLAKSIASRSSGDAAGAAWLRVAFAELARSDHHAALQAISNGLTTAPRSIALWSLELHLLATSNDAAAFGAAIESCAEVLTHDNAKARYYVAAAEVWARRSKNSTSARAALAQAALFGAQPRTVNRVARLLATQLGDAAWYDESTRRLATSTSNIEEQCELWLELVRVRLAKDQPERLSSAIAGLATTDPGKWLAATIGAYGLPDSPSATNRPVDAGTTSLIPDPANVAIGSEKPLLRLATLAPNTTFKRAYSLCHVVRELREENRESAILELARLSEQDPSDGLVILALSELQVAKGDRQAAASTLCSGANAIPSDNLAGMMALTAAFLAAESSDTSQCLVAVDCARSRVPAVAAVVESWLLRRLLPNDARVRRQLTDVVLEGGARDRVALERFALELLTQNLAAAGVALESVTPNDSALGIAVALARVLLDSATNLEAIDAVVSLLASFEPVAAALRSRLTLTTYQVYSSEHLQAAKHWASVDATTAAALDYLVATRASGALDAELDAWNALSQRTAEPLRAQIELAQARCRLFSTRTFPPLLSSRTVEHRLLNLEASRPGCDPRRRRYSLQGVLPLLDGADKTVGQLLIAYNSLAAGLPEEAFAQFKELVTEYPNNLGAWEGLRLAAQLCHNPKEVAQACEALGNGLQDPGIAAEFFEEAATIWLDELADEPRGEHALSLSVARDIQRFSAFDRLFRRVRDKNDGPRLLDLIEARLNVSDDVDELVKLHWERARVLRGLGDREAALLALENVNLLEPDHVGALALAAEISIATNRFSDAAKYLDRLARLESAPKNQRVMSGLAAADLFDSKLNLPELAVSVLLVLDNANLSTLAVRERIARSAARSENWDLAGEFLTGLADTRESSVGRVEAARLVLSIYRDKIASPASALPAVQRLFTELPYDGEAIDYLLEQPFSPDENCDLCSRARDALRERIFDEPFDSESIDRLAQVAAILDDAPLRQVALSALVMLEAGTPEIEEELTRLQSRIARVPTIAIDEACYSELAADGDEGPISDLFRQLAPCFSEALGPGLTVLGVTKKQRIDPRSGLPVRNEIAAWAGALGLGEFDLYIGGIEPDNVVGIPTETPALVIGTSVRSPLHPQHRQLVARELCAIRRGTSVLRHRSPADIAALVVATCRLADVNISAPAYALVDEFSRLLSSVLPRRVRKSLPTICAALAKSTVDPLDWYVAATGSLDRMAALAAGDVSLVVGQAAIHGITEAMSSLRERQERLLRYVFSLNYLSLRERLGVRVR